MSRSRTIGVDVRMWSHPGIGRYLRELVPRLDAALGERLRLFSAQGERDPFIQSRARRIETRSGIYTTGEQMEMALKGLRLGLLHVPHFNIPVLRQGKLVVTVHDLIYLHDAQASRSRWGRDYVRFLFKVIERKASAVRVVCPVTTCPNAICVLPSHTCAKPAS